MLIHDCSSHADTFRVQPESLRLSNGLHVKLVHLPGAVQAAAIVRVAAGSHDAPQQYPGLAHFLEHLLFLGSAGFAAQAGLLAYVRACGGQVNASTRERQTDYFFEAPAGRLAQGLARLCDMLAQPQLEVATQLQEREVLQAEFVARGQDRDTLVDAALGQALAAGHPFSAFHAGNRDSLKVEHGAFQRALRGFHQRFYQAGQMTLLLVGPQPLAELRHLAQRYGARLGAAPAVTQSAVPALLPLRSQAIELQVPSGLPRLSLCFALQAMPAGFAQALDFLDTWLSHEGEGGLLDSLRSRGCCDGVQVRLAYEYAGQALLVIDCELMQNTDAARAGIREALFDWLAFFTKQADWQRLQREYSSIVAQRLRGFSPLQLAQYWVDRQAGDEVLNADQPQALRHLLAQLQLAHLLELTSSCAELGCERQVGFTLRMRTTSQSAATAESWRWRLPEANRLLRPGGVVSRPAPGPAFEGLRWHAASAEPEGGEAVLYLCWDFSTSPPGGGFEVLQVALRAYQQLARQAGVTVRLEPLGTVWQVQFSGAAALLPAALEAFVAVLESLPAAAWEQGLRRYAERAQHGASEPLIRQLWQRLPELFTVLEPCANEPLATPTGLAQCWQQARLQGLAVGLPSSQRSVFDALFWRLPGRAGTGTRVPPAAMLSGQHWRDAGQPASEAALLLFCPVPDRQAHTQVAWRLLAQWLESAFFQRLRTELQLGYAVFCGFRQVAMQHGLLFAVQSPTASAAEILGHIEVFLDAQSARIARLDAAHFSQLRDNLREQLLSQAASVSGMAAQAWAALLAGQAADWPEQLQAQLAALQPEDLLRHYQLLRAAKGGWHVLANAASPHAPWHRQS
jgi:coenzyme PQQ biosynthesis probable peptidase PqqF